MQESLATWSFVELPIKPPTFKLLTILIPSTTGPLPLSIQHLITMRGFNNPFILILALASVAVAVPTVPDVKPNAPILDTVVPVVSYAAAPAVTIVPSAPHAQPASAKKCNPPGASCNIFDDVCCRGWCIPVGILVVNLLHV